MKYIIKPIVCDYAVICVDTGKIMCICNIKRNAELIADILNADNDNACAYSYDLYPNAKYKVIIPKNCVHCNNIGIRELLDCKLIFSGCANCGRHPNCPLKSVE